MKEGFFVVLRINTFTVLKEMELSKKARGLQKSTIKCNQDYNRRFLHYVKDNFNILRVFIQLKNILYGHIE